MPVTDINLRTICPGALASTHRIAWWTSSPLLVIFNFFLMFTRRPELAGGINRRAAEVALSQFVFFTGTLSTSITLSFSSHTAISAWPSRFASTFARSIAICFFTGFA